MAKYVMKSPGQQVSDLNQLELYKRIDKEQYFEELQLCNKLEGVDTFEAVNEADRFLSERRAAELEKNPIDGKFNLAHYKAVHEHLFQDIYYFAGQLRDVDMEIDSITRFTPANKLQPALDKFFTKLNNVDKNLQGLNKEAFKEKLADYLTDINKLHPAREGNGRTKRTFFRQLAKEAGYELNWAACSKDEWKLADECAFDSKRDYGVSDTTYLKELLKKAISPVSLDEAGAGNLGGKRREYSAAFLEQMQGMGVPSPKQTVLQKITDNENGNFAE